MPALQANKLLSPGKAPKTNTLHPAAQGLLIAAVARSNAFVVTGGSAYPGGKTSTQAGSPTAAVLGNIGACVKFTGSSDYCSFSGFPTGPVSPITFGCIFQLIGTLANRQVIGITGSTTAHGVGLGSDATTTNPMSIQNGGVSNPSFQFGAFSLGVPYFFGMSWKTASGPAISSVVVNLANGQTYFTSTGTIAGTMLASDGTFSIGNITGGTRQLNGYVAAVAASQVALSNAQLYQWAQNPWDLWYSTALTSQSNLALFSLGTPVIVKPRSFGTIIG